MSSVDVIVPCYLYGHFLRVCVDSVLTQSVQNIRVLIIDDASPDNTAEVAADLAREDSRVTFLRHSTNKGHIATYNEGIDWASADYVLLLSADDYLLPGALSRSVKFMDEHPEVGFTFGKAIELNDRCIKKQKIVTAHSADKTDWRILGGLEFIELSGARNIVCTPTAVVRTELQKRFGGYRPELPHSGDMEMWLRLAAHASVGVSEEYLAVYRRHGSNMSEAYMTKSWLPDLQQRKDALDYFFQTCSCSLLNAHDLHSRLFWLLGCEAVCFASAAFNMREIENSARLSEFALMVCPRVKRSWPWARLKCKQLLGFKVWHNFQKSIESAKAYWL